MTVAFADLVAAAGDGLVELVEAADGAPDAIVGCTHDSREAAPGMVFAAMPGDHVDGADFAAAAVADGAVAVICERPLGTGATEVVVDDVRRRLGPIAVAAYDAPADRLDLIGITGTNGKTSVAGLCAPVLGAGDRRVGVMGTLSGAHTTPEAPHLQARLAEASRTHDTMALEVSSHALALHRVDGTRFACTVFTNLGRDHLDFHTDLADYEAAKARLFLDGFADTAVINLDDPAGRRIADAARAAGVEVVGYELAQAESLEIRGARSSFIWRGHPVTLHLAGRHNVMNALAAATVGLVLGLDEHDLVDGIGRAEPVRGRMEMVERGQDFTVVVDYAHKPQALEAAISAGRELITGAGRLLLVMGCGGDRDEGKRPEMGRIAEAGADLVVVTDDNPRTEDPARIRAAIVAGMTDTGSAVEIGDRAEAIGHAIGTAGAGDVVLIAGKGHETHQIVGSERLEFDDRLAAWRALAADPDGIGEPTGETDAP